MPGDELSCANVREVQVRFSDPGFVDHNEVGLFVKYLGMPPGEKILRIWWDFEPGLWQDFHVGEGEVERHDPNLLNFEGILRHTYQGI